MAATAHGDGPLFGTVSAFDAERGLGAVTGAAGETWSFHATAIADGSRSIEVGARVAFVIVPGHLGRMEARALSRLYADEAWVTPPDSSSWTSVPFDA